MATFRVPKGIFVSLSEDETAMGFRIPREERAEMIAAEPEKFFVREGHDDRYDRLRVRLDGVGDEELRAIIVDSWRQVAPKKAVAEFDAR